MSLEDIGIILIVVQSQSQSMISKCGSRNL